MTRSHVKRPTSRFGRFRRAAARRAAARRRASTTATTCVPKYWAPRTRPPAPVRRAAPGQRRPRGRGSPAASPASRRWDPRSIHSPHPPLAGQCLFLHPGSPNLEMPPTSARGSPTPLRRRLCSARFRRAVHPVAHIRQAKSCAPNVRDRSRPQCSGQLSHALRIRARCTSPSVCGQMPQS